MKAASLAVALFVGLQYLASFGVGYVTPTGQLCPFQSKALAAYEAQLEVVRTAFKNIGLLAINRDEWELGQLLQDPLYWNQFYLRSHYQTIDAFLWEWNKLSEFRQDSLSDFQLREYLLEPTMGNLQLAKMADYIPILQHNRHRYRAKYERKRFQVTLQRRFHLLWRRFCLWLKWRKWPESVPSNCTASLFSKESLQKLSPAVRQECNQLVDDHEHLIVSCSEHFGGYSIAQKKAFVECLEDVEERWDMLYQRFHLMGVLNPEFLTHCSAYLAALGLNEMEYQKIHKRNHQRIVDGKAEEVPYFSDISNTKKRTRKTPFGGALRRLPRTCFGMLRKLVGARPGAPKSSTMA